MNERDLDYLLKQVKLLWKLEDSIRTNLINPAEVELILKKLDEMRKK
jgi:hypothetical protein